MRTSVRGAIVGAALLPLAVAGPGMAFAGSTGYEEPSRKDHSKHEGHGKDHHGKDHHGKDHHKDGDHKHGHHKHDKKHDHKHEHGHKKAEKTESPVPEPLAGVLDLITGATGGEMAAGPVG